MTKCEKREDIVDSKGSKGYKYYIETPNDCETAIVEAALVLTNVINRYYVTHSNICNRREVIDQILGVVTEIISTMNIDDSLELIRPFCIDSSPNNVEIALQYTE